MTLYNSSYGNTIPFSDLTVQLSLLANQDLTYTIAASDSITFKVIFSASKKYNYWVGFNTIAEVPILGTINQNRFIEKNPEFRFVRGGDTLSFKSDQNVTDIGLSIYILPQFGQVSPIPPTFDNFLLLDGSFFLLLDGTNFLLL